MPNSQPQRPRRACEKTLVTARAVRCALADPDISRRSLRMSASALIRSAEDARRLFPWPALERSLLADATALLERAANMEA